MATGPSATTRRRGGGSEDGRVDPALPQKKRARHRLIGAIALCGLAAVVVPMLLDSEPTRPSSEVAIVIPSRDTPLPARTADAAPAEAPRGATSARGAIEAAPAAEAGSRDTKVPDPKAGAPKAADPKGGDGKGTDGKGGDGKSAEGRSSEAKPGDAKAAAARPAPARADEAKGGDPRAADPKVPRKEPQGDEIARLAEAAQQGRARAETGGRYVLQVGAYSGEAGAASAVDRVQGTGLTAFTEKIRTDRGERVRVRVGPFATREAAEQARGRLKAAGIEAAVIAP